jgi:hypothetical protein
LGSISGSKEEVASGLSQFSRGRSIPMYGPARLASGAILQHTEERVPTLASFEHESEERKSIHIAH